MRNSHNTLELNQRVERNAQSQSRPDPGDYSLLEVPKLRKEVPHSNQDMAEAKRSLIFMNVRKRGRGSLNIESRMVWKAQAIHEGFKLDTHILREKMIFQLQALFDMANQRALDCHPKQWKEKQNWTRIAGYIGQVINSLSNTYDLSKVEEDLTDLATLLSNITEGKTEEVQKALAKIEAAKQETETEKDQSNESAAAI
jgi:hypothetical protein